MSLTSKLTRMATVAVATTVLTLGAAHAKNFKMALGDGAGGTQENAGKEFIKAFTELTGGKHEVAMFLNGQLGSEQDTVNDAAIGTLDFSVLAINNITPFSPTVGSLTLPYVILSLEDAETLTQGPIGDELVENTLRDAGVRIISWSYAGFRVLTNSKMPVTTIDDLQQLVVRVPKNEIMIETYKAWGVDPTPLAWAETFTALQQKVVDAQDNPLITINAMKFDEVQKYITNIRYIYLIEPIIISEAVFQDLPEEDQAAVLEAGRIATLKSGEYIREREQTIRTELQEKGMEFVDPADGEAEFIELATEAVWPQFYDSIGGKDKLNAILAAIGRDPVE